MEETFETFSEAAIKEFGEVFFLGELNISQDQIDEINKAKGCHLTKQDFLDKGKKVILLEPKCPKCRSDLGGLFGTFNWGLVHGTGYCSKCENQIIFRCYHYIGECKEPIIFWELIGF